MRTIAKPFIPWVGGKEKLAPYVRQVLPPKPKAYVEPFGGSGAILLGLPAAKTRIDVYNDFNADLVNLFLCVRDSSITLMKELEYGSWTSHDATQHKRTKSCSVCGDSTYEYGNHADANADGKCDTCGYAMSVTVTWDAGTNGGKVNGAASVTTSVPLNTTAAAPSYTPTKTGHTFTNWYTAATGGSLYSTVTITAARTFYAQFTANTYTITWDLGGGRTETTKQEYGKALVLPSKEPTRDTAYFDGWYTETTGGTKVDGSTMFDGTSDTTYYAHWIEVFSVTIPRIDVIIYQIIESQPTYKQYYDTYQTISDGGFSLPYG